MNFDDERTCAVSLKHQIPASVTIAQVTGLRTRERDPVLVHHTWSLPLSCIILMQACFVPGESTGRPPDQAALARSDGAMQDF